MHREHCDDAFKEMPSSYWLNSEELWRSIRQSIRVEKAHGAGAIGKPYVLNVVIQYPKRHALCLVLGQSEPDGCCMLGIPRRFGHFVFGVIQSGLTCAIAAAIASYPFVGSGTFTEHWLRSLLLSWILMLPIVVLAAPAVRRLTEILTRED